MKRKLISIALSLCMILSLGMFSTTASAAGGPFSTEYYYEIRYGSSMYMTAPENLADGELVTLMDSRSYLKNRQSFRLVQVYDNDNVYQIYLKSEGSNNEVYGLTVNGEGKLCLRKGSSSYFRITAPYSNPKETGSRIALDGLQYNSLYGASDNCIYIMTGVNTNWTLESTGLV